MSNLVGTVGAGRWVVGVAMKKEREKDGKRERERVTL